MGGAQRLAAPRAPAGRHAFAKLLPLDRDIGKASLLGGLGRCGLSVCCMLVALGE
jgi:hypothetical protein